MSNRAIRRIVKVTDEFCTTGQSDPKSGERPSNRRKLRHVVQTVNANAPELLVSFQQKSGLTQAQINAAIAGERLRSTSAQRAGILNFVKEIAEENMIPIPVTLSKRIDGFSGPASV